MTTPSDTSFTSDVAKFYESTLVPLIFEPYAADLAQRARALAPGSVLEVACGTGVVTRAQWGARNANPSNLTRHRGAWKYITIHHSAMEGGVELTETDVEILELASPLL